MASALPAIQQNNYPTSPLATLQIPIVNVDDNHKDNFIAKSTGKQKVKCSEIVASPQTDGSGPFGKREFSKITLTSLNIGDKKMRDKRLAKQQDKKLLLRSKQPALDKRETHRYRNEHKHTLCVQMLRDGYHVSFAELFGLLGRDDDERARAGPDSELCLRPRLQQQPLKLELLRRLLTQAEDAMRKDDVDRVYASHVQLARSFREQGDVMLAEHFFDRALQSAKRSRKMAPIAHRDVALAQEENENLEEAQKNFLVYYWLAMDADADDDADGDADGDGDGDADGDGGASRKDACLQLSRIYSKKAAQRHAEGQLSEYLAESEKSHTMAIESRQEEEICDATFRLGNAFWHSKCYPRSLQLLESSLEVARRRSNSTRTIAALEAIARCHQSLGDVRSALERLLEAVRAAEDAGDDKSLSRTSSQLGALYNHLGEYGKAVSHFNRAYNIARSTGDTESISSSRVLFGLATAHNMQDSATDHFRSTDQHSLQRLLAWKDDRIEAFGPQQLPPEIDEYDAIGETFRMKSMF